MVSSGGYSEGRAGPIPDNNALVINFEGVASTFEPTEQADFGRGARIDIDDNPYLHRRLGRFTFQDRWWWLQNLGTNIVLQLIDPETGAASRIPPGTQGVLLHQHSVIRFEAGRVRYELIADQAHRPPRPADPEPPQGDPPTIDLTEPPINDEQRLLLLHLCEARLRDPFGLLELPSNQEIADRLGWSLRKLNRKLDWLCDRLARQGVAGVKDPMGRATRRRDRLVEYAVNSGLVTFDDLRDLDPAD